MDKTTARIIKHAQQSAGIGGQPLTIAELARRYKLSQGAVFALVVEEATDELDVEIGRVVDGEWVAYSSIGEYPVVPTPNWTQLYTMLVGCKGRHPDKAVNETIDQLLYLLE